MGDRATLSGPLWAARAVAAAAFLDLFMQFPTMAPFAVALGTPTALVGLIVAAYSVANLAGNMVGGAILDRWGRRRPLVGGLATAAAAAVAYTLVSRPEHLLVVRATHGFVAAVLTVGAFAVMGDVAEPHRRAQVMGQGGALIGGAAVVGPPTAGVLMDRTGFDGVFGTTAALMTLACAAVWRWAREPPGGSAPSRRTSPWRVRLTRPVGAAWSAVFAYAVGLGAVVTHLALYLRAAGYAGAVTGMAFGLFALVAAAVMLSPLTRASDARGRRLPLGIGLAVVAAGLLAMAGGARAALAGMAIFGLGFGLAFPSAAALVAESVESGERGRAFGVFYALWSLGVVSGAGLADGLARWQGAVTGAAFAAAAVVALLGGGAVLLLLPRQPEAWRPTP
jgi:DHA1 family multidrug resistance protein-like MFS transporter